jgi:hypothetical protein
VFQDLKRAILDNKPDDIASYVLLYGIAATSAPSAEEIIVPKTKATVKQYKKPEKAQTPAKDAKTRSNKVTPSNSIIKLQERIDAPPLDI